MTHVQKMTLPHSLAGKDVLGIGSLRANQDRSV
jgi:hypothetical protein